MIDLTERCFHCFDHRQAGSLGTLDHDYPDAEAPCRFDFRIGRIATAVLGDDHVDPMSPQQIQLVLQPERSPAVDVVDVRYRQRRLDGIDAADAVVVMRRRVRLMRLLPAGRQEDAQGCVTKGGYGLRNAMHREPVIAFDRYPGRAAQRKGRHIAFRSGPGRVGGDAGSEGMGSVDHQIDGFVTKIAGKPLGATETAAAYWNGLRRRIGGPAGKRQDNVEIGARGKGCRQRTGLRRAAQDQNTGLAHG